MIRRSSSLRIRSKTADGASPTCLAISALEVRAFSCRIFSICVSIKSIILRIYISREYSSSNQGYSQMHDQKPPSLQKVAQALPCHPEKQRLPCHPWEQSDEGSAPRGSAWT